MPQRPLIAVCANQAWNLVNFRGGLITALLASGWRVLAIAPPDPPNEARLRALGCEFEPLAVDSKGLSPIRDIRTGLGLIRVLRRYRPAAFLSWTIKPNIYGAMAARLLAIPAFPNVSGLGTAFIRTNLLTLLASALYRIGFGGAARVFFQNEDDRDLFLAKGLVRPAQARMLPGSGIDLDYWHPGPGERPAARNFLMIARVVADKGVREYVEAACAVRQVWPDARFSLLGPAAVANRTAISRAELDAWVREGAIAHLPPCDDVRPMIAAADFIVLPSYREGLSRVLLEAAAMGRPIVTCDVPGCREVVSEGVNGYLCEPRSAASLAQALLRAAAVADADWARMAAAGRERVAAHFSIERVTRIYLETLRSAGIVAANRAL